MDKCNVVVKDEEVKDYHCKLDKQGQEKTNYSCILRFLVVVVKFEQITIGILVRKIDHVDYEEVKHRCQPIPCNYLAKLDRKAENISLGQMAGQNEKAEDQSVGKIAHHDDSKLLELAPISILQGNLVESLKLVF